MNRRLPACLYASRVITRTAPGRAKGASRDCKNVEIIKEVIPSVRRVALLANQPDPFHATLIQHFQQAAAQLKIETKIVLARAGDDFDRHFAAVRIGAAKRFWSSPACL